ncbi:alpha/beta hydrolase [Undibacterium sp.]|jgi:pimeloyl-ACP methyl ester carboxylesterase|uniref:alpha/beta fold hydrolase n=1 Tax=Undibacterium sp. TaxID=1914977 RepID=UPI002BF4C134|nr:alpha/beta hydrolase [Undibacterium sp.]HTD03471.1 alpha/beta hydrolase [Undibacterium sp.]
MPYATNNGIRIYYEVHGDGEPLVLLHGFSSASKLWHMAGYVAGLKRSHRLILIDLRGHGLSDKPHDAAAYVLKKRLDDIGAVLAELGISRSHFLAYSMGGWLAFGLAVHYPQLVASLIIGCPHPYADSLAAFSHIDGSDPAAFIEALESFIGEAVSKEARPYLLQNDLLALAAAANDRMGYAARLHDIQAPLMLFAGAGDQRLSLIQRAATELDAEKLLVLPGANHATTLFAANTLLPEIRDFLQSHR